MTYNGWSNYETWCVNLWLTNDEGSDSLLREWAQEAYNDAEESKNFTRKEEAVFSLERMIESYIDEMRDDLPIETSMFSDLLGHAIGMADLREIAEGFMEDVEEEVEEA